MSMKRWFSPLNSFLVAKDNFLDSGTLFRMYAFGNALFEGVYDACSDATGAVVQKIKGHDHMPTASGGQGGCGVTRNLCYMGGRGTEGIALFNADMRSVDFSSGTPVYIDGVLSGSQVARTTATVPTFQMLPSEQFITSINALAKLSVSMVFKNLDLSSVDFTVTIYDSGGTPYILGTVDTLIAGGSVKLTANGLLPVVAGINSFWIKVQNDIASDYALETLSLVVSEGELA